MIEQLTSTQLEVLQEYVKYARRINRSHKPVLIKAELFDYEHGDGEAIELLNKHFYDLMKVANLDRDELRELAEIISERERLYDAVEPDNIFDVDLTELNKQRLVRLKNYPTNGKEYL